MVRVRRLRAPVAVNTLALPATRWPARAPTQPSLAQCVTLAVLMHVLVVLVFGTVQGGGSPDGDRTGGPLTETR